MEFHKVASVSEIAEGQMKEVSAAGKHILLTNVSGSFYAINNKCTHVGGPLSKGKLEGSVVTCPWHHAQFDVTTGKACSGAKVMMINMNVKDEECYTVKVEGNDILVGVS